MQTIVSYLLADVAEEIFLPTPWREMDLPTWDSEVLVIFENHTIPVI